MTSHLKQIKIETEALQIAVYCEIILTILDKYEHLSVNKLTVFSYLIKQNSRSSKIIYDGKTKKLVLEKAISLLSGNFLDYCENVVYIIKSIHLLVKTKMVLVSQGNLNLLGNVDFIPKNIVIDKFIDRAIKESEMMSESQFMKEVMRSV